MFRIVLCALLALPGGFALSSSKNRTDIEVAKAKLVKGDSHINIRADAKANAKSDIEVDSEGDMKNKMFKMSPQDKTYDTHNVDDNEKFHAPSLAPNDKQPNSGDEFLRKQATEDETNVDSMKGAKGSVILNDYDPTRLGVSADEANKAKEFVKDEFEDTVKEFLKDKLTDAGKKESKKESKKMPSVEDSLRAVEENKASAHKSRPITSTFASAFAKAHAQTKETQASKADKPKPKPDAEKIKTDGEKHSEKSNKPSTSSGKNSIEAAKTAAEVAKYNGHQYGRLIGSAMMIIVSEIGDKTFFIAALMAMRHKPWFVFSSSYSAMVVMTVLSMVLGLVLPSLLSRRVTTLLAALLFLAFGFRMVKEAWLMDKNIAATEELEEVEQDLAMSEKAIAIEKAEAGGISGDGSNIRSISKGILNLAQLIFSPVWIQIFVMTFLGEWGDRSQIATVAMGASKGWAEVLTGCLFGHLITTAVAVMGGKILAKQLSLRTVTAGGAACFLLFAVIYFNDWLQQYKLIM